jgi:hypothetical protein
VTEPVQDLYEQRYSERLWSLLPALYRAADSEVVDGTGPLREILDRIGTSMAVVRRSIDRLWEDQSIETCDSWVIPYVAQLLATNLVPSMDPRGQRLDVANTIYYRRRKGTVALLEELAHDVTGYEVRVIEFFRRSARNRHNLDPAIGRPADAVDPAAALALQRSERLTGLLTRTPAGGWADLRHPLGATLVDTAYDEYHHRVDVRLGRGALGWYGIAKVGFFLWRSVSITVERATPVPVDQCPGHYTFDPTGRQIPLFTAQSRGGNDYGESWTPIPLWQVPMPLTEALWRAVVDELHPTPGPTPGPAAYPDPDVTLWPISLSVSGLGSADPLDLGEVTIWPEVGRFATGAGAPRQVEVGYHYGLFDRIGAGPYDRRVLGAEQPSDPQPVVSIDGGSAIALPAALATVGVQGSVVITNALTLTTVAPVGTPAAGVQQVTVRGVDEGRGVIRLDDGADPWVITGADGDAALRLEGLLFSGGDIALRGRFGEVTVSCCSLDPGDSGNLHTPPSIYGTSVDGRDLTPTTLWIEGAVEQVVLDRSITGPIRTRRGGVVEQLCVADSVVQGLASEAPGTLATLRDDEAIFAALKHQRDELTTWLAAQLSAATLTAVTNYADATPIPAADAAALVADLQSVIDGPLIWTASRFANRPLRDSTAAAVLTPPNGAELAALNRQLLAEAFPQSLADAAIALDAGLTEVVRSSILGPAYLHSLECSESILDDVVRVRDAQNGCVRFSAWSTDSALPRRYESVQIAPSSPIMVSRRFGEWGYAQLHDGADSAILSGNTGAEPSLLTGAHNGSEIGVFNRAGAAIKDRSLLIKLQEFLPIGLSPVLVHLPQADPDGEYTRGRPWPPM